MPQGVVLMSILHLEAHQHSVDVGINGACWKSTVSYLECVMLLADRGAGPPLCLKYNLFNVAIQELIRLPLP